MRMIGADTDIQMRLWKCGGPITDIEECLKEVTYIVRKYGMGVRVIARDPYEGGGFEGLITLEESFVLIETWPEALLVKVWINLCHFKRNNSKAAKKIAEDIKELFSSEEMKVAYYRLWEFEGVPSE